MGLGISVAAVVGLVVETVQSGIFDLGDAVKMVAIAAVGVGAIASWAARLPGWARTRREQMEAIAARLLASLRTKS